MSEANMLDVILGITLDAQEVAEVKELRDLLKQVNEFQKDIESRPLPSIKGVSLSKDREVAEALKAVEISTKSTTKDIRDDIKTVDIKSDQNTTEILSNINTFQAEIFSRVNELALRFGDAQTFNPSTYEAKRYLSSMTKESATQKAKQIYKNYPQPEIIPGRLGLSKNAGEAEIVDALGDAILTSSNIAMQLSDEKKVEAYNLIGEMISRPNSVALDKLVSGLIPEVKLTAAALGFEGTSGVISGSGLNLTSNKGVLQSWGREGDTAKEYAKLLSKLPKGMNETTFTKEEVGSMMQAKDVGDIMKIVGDPKRISLASKNIVGQQELPPLFWEAYKAKNQTSLDKMGVDLNDMITSKRGDVIITLTEESAQELLNLFTSSRGDLEDKLKSIPGFDKMLDQTFTFITDKIIGMITDKYEDSGGRIWQQELKPGKVGMGEEILKHMVAINAGYAGVSMMVGKGGFGVPKVKVEETTELDVKQAYLEQAQKTMQLYQSVSQVAALPGGEQFKDLSNQLKEVIDIFSRNVLPAKTTKEDDHQ